MSNKSVRTFSFEKRTKSDGSGFGLKRNINYKKHLIVRHLYAKLRFVLFGKYFQYFV